MEQLLACEAHQPATHTHFGRGCFHKDQVDAANDSATSGISSCHRAIRHKPSQAVRQLPYIVPFSFTVTTLACTSASAQLQFNPTFTPAPLQQLQPLPCCDMRQMADGTPLKQQPLEALLDIAIMLAGRSLNRTMAAFQAACSCWSVAEDSVAAGQALDFAESCMARTMHRMQIVQQLAAAVLSSGQHKKCAAQQQEQQHLLQLMRALQQQYKCNMQDDGTEEGEEACSSWRPADEPAVAC